MESELAYKWEVLMCPYDPILIHTHDPLSIYARVTVCAVGNIHICTHKYVTGIIYAYVFISGW